ncbi:MAG: putative peptidoglycan-binding domain-containing protein [Paludibacteraceae bacterium]
MATKKSTWKVVIIVLVVLAIVGVGVWGGFKFFGTDDTPTTDGGTGKPSGSAGSTPASSDVKFPLVDGSRGELVKRLQRALNTDLDGCDGFKKLVVDGIVGPKTIAAAKLAVGTQLLTDETICRNYIANMGC